MDNENQPTGNEAPGEKTIEEAAKHQVPGFYGFMLLQLASLLPKEVPNKQIIEEAAKHHAEAIYKFMLLQLASWISKDESELASFVEELRNRSPEPDKTDEDAVKTTPEEAPDEKQLDAAAQYEKSLQEEAEQGPKINFKPGIARWLGLEKTQEPEVEELDKPDENTVKTTNKDMEVEKPRIPQEEEQQATEKVKQQPALPLSKLHQALEEAGAYDRLKKPRDRKVLQKWLTSEEPMGDFMSETGITTPQGVNKLIHRKLQEIFQYLPDDVQREYKSAKKAIKLKTDTQLKTDISKGRIKEGLDKSTKVGRPKGKADRQPRTEFSDTHRQHLSDALKRYHREQKEHSTPAQEEHTIVDLPKLPHHQ